MSAFSDVLEQIDAFIRKYYKNQMVRGALLFVIIFLVSFMFTTFLEYMGRFGSLSRATLLFVFCALNLFVLVRFIFIPLSRLFAFGKRIDRYQAADIIGSFFPGVSDRLKNMLQLESDLSQQVGNVELLKASIQQRSNTLKVIPFTQAVDISENRKYLKYVIPVVLFFIVLAIIVPGMYVQGTERVLNYNKEFVLEAPFAFNMDKENYILEEGNDLPLTLNLTGKELPDQVYLISENGKFLMNKIGKTRFEGLIKKPSQSGSFHFVANDFVSKRYKLEVFGKAAIGKFECDLVYPKYIGKQNEKVTNAGDISVPEGTVVTWSGVTKNTEYVSFVWNGKKESFLQDGFKVTKKLTTTSLGGVLLKNKFSKRIDTIPFSVNVVKDAYPTIQVVEDTDSVSEGLRFFNGLVHDDYGLTGLSFVYKVISEDGGSRTNKLSVTGVKGTEQKFDFAVDFRREKLKLKDRVEYYFVVTDNDGVNGSKSTRSQVYTYKLPSLEELNEKRDEDNKEINNQLQNVLDKALNFQDKVKKLKKENVSNNKSDWNKMNQVNQLKEEQKSIEKALKDLQEKMQNSLQEKNQLSELDRELLEKEALIEQLLKDVMDKELMDLLDQLEKLLEKNQKDNVKEKLDALEQSAEDRKKQLDRSIEMLKKLQVNEKIDDIEKELKALSEEQSGLKKDADEKKLSKEEVQKKQEELNKKFDELKNDLKEMQDLNKELMSPIPLDGLDKMEENISEEMQEAKDQLQKQKQQKAGEHQKNAAQQMKEMADELNKQQEKANQQQQEEDINSLRSILESLMILSFDQEDVMLRFNKVLDNDPAYRRFGRQQRSIINGTGVVRDSLLALAKRQPKIATFVDKELNTIASNQDLLLEDIDEHRKRELGIHQQTVMTSYNNLALLLNESLQSMQQQMQNMMEGSGSCNNPGGKGKAKPGSSMSPGDMKQMLKKQLEQMQKGPNPGGEKPGDQPGNKPGNKDGMGMMGLGNKEIAKMAAEQTAIRQRLEQLRNELNKDGQGKGNQLNPLIKELEQQEKDLINKQFSPEMIKRQQNIMTRLLESEKALMERGFEEKRESTSGKNENYGNKIRFEEYTKQKQRELELLRAVDPAYNKYYKDKANEYFNQGL